MRAGNGDATNLASIGLRTGSVEGETAVRKAAVASAIFAAGLLATAVWAVTRDDTPKPTLATGGDQTATTSPSSTDGRSATDGPRLTVSALDVAPGDRVTVSGTGCGTDAPVTEAGTIVGAWSVHVWLSPAPGTVTWDPSFADPIALVPPEDDGSWSTTISVPEWHTEYRLEAACFDEASPPHGFVYRHERLVVT
jgi:hypothetical protein